MQFSILFFSTDEGQVEGDRYRLVLDAARFADERRMHAIWTPERHFHQFGGIFPNPAVLGAGLAAVTKRVQLRAGSVVLPLHHPARVAEEWSVVDNLSHGRVGLAFAAGYSPTDFTLAPDAYADRNRLLVEKVDVVRRLWRGDAIAFRDGNDKQAEIRIHPKPVQPELPVWITCGGSDAEKFRTAGAAGANVLTALFVQSVDELKRRIALYREARAKEGHDPSAGQVTLMLHTFLGRTIDEARAVIHRPFIDYLRASVEVWAKGFKRLEDVPEHRREDMLSFAFERYFRTSALFGTAESCRPLLANLAAIGVDEIACLVDFGVEPRLVLESLERVVELKSSWHTAA